MLSPQNGPHHHDPRRRARHAGRRPRGRGPDGPLPHDAHAAHRARSGLQLRLTCPSGAVTGYGYEGADALAINGSRILSRHTVRPKVEAALDRNHDGRFTGTVYAFCEGGHN